MRRKSTREKVLDILLEVGEPVHVSYVALQGWPGNPEAKIPDIRVALHRLVRAGDAERVSRGVYKASVN